MPSPVDGSIWGSTLGVPGAVVRLAPGANPPETALAEVYNVPMPGFGARGADIDSKGVVWVSLGSGHMGSFDRRKCKAPLNGPKATGDHCPEGWSFHQYPGPGFQGIGENSAESSYYSWVDQHNTFGLGNDVPMSTGNLNDGLIAFANGRMVVLRVPYPMGFYAKGFDGRIDDPKAGWKGRGLWAANGDRTPWLIEGGKGTKPSPFLSFPPPANPAFGGWGGGWVVGEGQNRNAASKQGAGGRPRGGRGAGGVRRRCGGGAPPRGGGNAGDGAARAGGTGGGGGA